MPEAIPLSRSAERTRAAALIHTASAEPLVITRAAAMLCAEIIDRVSWSVLDQAGVDREAAREVLALLWADTPGGVGGNTQWDG